MEEELELFKYSVKESKTPPLLENKARIFRLMNLLNKNKSSNRCLAIIEHMKNINQDECNNENDIRICNVMLNIRYINISIRIKKNIDRCYEMLENDIVYDPTPLKYYYKMQIMSYMDILQDSKSFFTTINDMKDSAKGWAVLANFDGKDIEDNNPIVKFLLQICGKIVLFDPFYADLSACIRNLKTQGWDSFNIILFYYDLIMPFTCCYPFLVDQIFSATIRMISLNKKPFHRRVLGHAYNCKKILICSDKETYIECRQLNYDNKLVHINESHDEFLSNIFDLYYSFVNLNTQPTVSLENESQPSLLDLALESQCSSFKKYMHCCKVYRTILTNVETTIRSLKNKINTCFLKIIYKRCLCGPKKIASKVMLELDFLHKLCLQFNEIKWEYTFIYVEWLIFKLKEIAKNALQCLGTSIGSPEFKAVLDECHIVTNLCQNYPSKSHTYRQTIYEIPPMGRKNLPKLTFSSVDARNDLNKVNDVYYDILLKERECNCDVSRVYELIRKFPINDVFLNITNANLKKVRNSITFRDESTYGNIKIQEVIPETLESNKTSLAKKSSSSEKFRDEWEKALRENVELEKQIKELKSKLKDTNKLSNKKDAIIGELTKKNSEGAKLHAFEKLQVKKLKKEKDTLSAELSEKQMEFVKIQDELEKYILLENKTRESCEYFKDVIDKSEQKKTILALEESLKQKCDKIASMELDIRDKDQKILSNCMLSQENEILRENFNKLKIFHENNVKNLREINIKQNEYIEKHQSTKLDLDASEYKLLSNKKDAIIGELTKKNSEGAKLHAFEKLQVKKLKKEKDTLSAELSEKQMEFVKIQDELEKYILLENKTRESCEYFKDVIDKSEQKKTILALEESLKQKCDKIASMELDIRDKDQKILSNCMLSQENEILRENFNKLKIFHENNVKNLREINIKQNEYIEKHQSTKLDLDASEYKLLSNKKDAIIGELTKKNSEGAKLHAFEKLQVKKLKKEKDTLSAELSEKQMEFVKIQDELEKYILLENKTRESCEYFKDVIDKSEQKKTILALEESLKQKCDKIASMELDIRDKDQKILSNCMLSQENEILRENFNKLKIFHENNVKNLREINIKQNEYIEKHQSTKLDLDASEYKLLTNGSERTLDYFLQIVKILSKYKLKEVPNSNELGTESVATNNFKEIFANNIVRQKELYSSIQYTIENLRTLSRIDLRNKETLFLLYECATNPNIYLKVFEEIANEYFKLFETVKQLCVNKNETKTTTDFVYPENSNTNNNSILSPYSWGSFHSEKSSSRNSICMPPFEPPTESKFSKAIGGPTPFAEKPIKTKKKSEDELSHWRPGGKYHIILKVIKESIPSCQDNVLMNVLIQVKGRNNNKLSNLTYDEIFKQAMDVFKEKLIPIPHDPCSICLEEFGNHLSKRLPCNHLFHRKCINGWLEANTCCPICKKHTTKMD